MRTPNFAPKVHRFALRISLVVLAAALLAPSCSRKEQEADRPDAARFAGSVVHPAWSRPVTMYEVNVRQYTPEGTFTAFAEHLPRLGDLGIGILWFMPIHPIGEQRRLGSLGSYYSVRDYRAVNPEFGTLDDFRALVERIHAMGMYVFMDWVGNHTAWDNVLTISHPEWFTKNDEGGFMPPIPQWGDVIDLDYDQPGLRRYMIDTMKFWAADVGVDGFRCDAAGMVPTDFWDEARRELAAVRPGIFLLAEWEGPELHENAFDASYGWKLGEIMTAVAAGDSTVGSIDRYFAAQPDEYSRDAIRLYFTSNHDINSGATDADRFGDGVRAFAVFTLTIDGMPLVYSGQEAGLDTRIAFFEKDEILWRDHPNGELYKALIHLKRDNPALWNGAAGAAMVRVPTGADDAVFAFTREKDGHAVFVVINLTNASADAVFGGDTFAGTYTDVLNGGQASFAAGARMTLGPWDYRVYSR